jgi:acyl-CoA thioesterase
MAAEPAAPDHERRAADERAGAHAAALYAQDAASRALGISVTDVSLGCATARMEITDSMVNGHGIAHGGYVFLLADSAFAFACNTYSEPTVAAGCDISFLAPVRSGEVLVARAEERYRVDRNGIYDVAVRRADGSVVAELRGRSRTVGAAGGAVGRPEGTGKE